MITLQNPLKYLGKWVLKWKQEEFLLILEMMWKKKFNRIFIAQCGRNEERKRHYIFKEKCEDGEQE